MEKKTQGPALIWSLGKKLQQQSTWDPKKIPRPRVRFETPDEYEAAEYKTFSRSGKYLIFSPSHFKGKISNFKGKG